MNFTQCYGSPLCSPSRTAFVSGKYNFRNYNEWGVYDLSSKTFANLAKDAGYTTFVAGKWQFDGGDSAVHTMVLMTIPCGTPSRQERPGRHYKDPKIYENEPSFLQPKRMDNMEMTYLPEGHSGSSNKTGTSSFSCFSRLRYATILIRLRPMILRFAGWNSGTLPM